MTSRRRLVTQPSLKPATIPEAVLSLFEIQGLFQDRDVSLSFNKGVKVIVGDNGSGKTTILNALYFALTGKYHRLSSIPFESISLTFLSGVKVTFTKDEMPNPFAWALQSNLLAESRVSLSGDEFIEVVKNFQESQSEKDFYFFMMRRGFDQKLALNPFTFYRTLSKAWESWISSDKVGNDISTALLKKSAVIEKQFPSQIIFLPTFRRVEEEITNLGLHLEKDEPRRAVKDSQIFFGMRDVEQLFNSLKEKIKTATNEAYIQTSRDMVNQLIDKGFKFDVEQFKGLRNEEAVSLILSRLGKPLSAKRKTELQAFLAGEEDKSGDIAVLAYILQNLMNVYTELRPIEDQIRTFVAIANNYLSGKTIKFNEVTAEISLIDSAGGTLRLQQLSSGEKQLISILSRIHLSEQRSFALIIDEPELSLSLDWQRTLLPDLLRSEKCCFLIAATHSPFIFENELDPFASIVKTKSRNVKSH